MNEPWVQPGQDVVEFTDRSTGMSRPPIMERTTIVRVGKRDVVLANGHRYNVNSLSKRSGGTWDPTTYVLHPDDPRVKAGQKLRKQSNAKFQAEEAWERFIKEPTEERADNLKHYVEQYMKARA